MRAPTIARWREGLVVIAALWLAGQAGHAYALDDPAKEYVEAPAVAARYPDPPLDIPTPAFKPGRSDFTSQEELVGFVDGLAARSADLRVRIVGQSQRLQIINGATLASTSLIVRVTPQTAGVFTIPDVAPNSQPLVLRVTPPGSPPAASGKPPALGAPGMGGGAGANGSGTGRCRRCCWGRC